MNRAFKGVWIPKEIWLSEELTLQEKIFLVEISSLDNENGCYASNAYFAKFFNLSKNRCSEVIKSLERKKLISIKYIRDKGKKSIDKRVIKVVDKPSGGTREVDRPIRDVEGGYSGNLEESNTSLNNTSNNTLDKDTMSSKPDDAPIPYKEIVDYLNQKADRKYKHTTGKTKTLIKARWNEGFSLDDFKQVIDNKVSEWRGTKMDKFLRPETLFGTKFEGYLNEGGGDDHGTSEYDNLF